MMAVAPLVAASRKSLYTLATALSFCNLYKKLSLGNVLTTWNSSFHSLEVFGSDPYKGAIVWHNYSAFETLTLVSAISIQLWNGWLGDVMK